MSQQAESQGTIQSVSSESRWPRWRRDVTMAGLGAVAAIATVNGATHHQHADAHSALTPAYIVGVECGDPATTNVQITHADGMYRAHCTDSRGGVQKVEELVNLRPGMTSKSARLLGFTGIMEVFQGKQDDGNLVLDFAGQDGIAAFGQPGVVRNQNSDTIGVARNGNINVNTNFVEGLINDTH